jgi:hypothetical protein
VASAQLERSPWQVSRSPLPVKPDTTDNGRIEHGPCVRALTGWDSRSSNSDTLSLWDTTRGDPNGKGWVTAVQPDGCHTIAAGRCHRWPVLRATCAPVTWAPNTHPLDDHDSAEHDSGDHPNAPAKSGRGQSHGVSQRLKAPTGEPTSGYGFVDLIG